MKIDYDHAKNNRNIRERGLAFERALDLDWETAKVRRDERKDYGESRIIALGYLDGRLHVLCFTPMRDGIRVISFRKANKREIAAYEKI